MLHGYEALQRIDHTLQTIRNESVAYDQQVSGLSQTLATLERQRLSFIQRMAGVRLAELESGELQTQLTAVDDQAEQLMQQRNTALSELNKQIEQLHTYLQSADEQRTVLLESVNKASAMIVDTEAKVQAGLKTDADYLEQYARSNEAHSVAEEAQQKVERAQLDMAKKAEPYEKDHLFMYLWQRGYGTTEYRGGVFARSLDGWVARLINYEASRVNFWNLTEIPKRLNEHAERKNAAAEQAYSALQDLETAALNESAIRQYQTDYEARQAELDQFDDTVQAQEDELNQKLQQRTQFTSGQDGYIQKALALLGGVLKRQSLQEIGRKVRETHSFEDDDLLRQLELIQDDIERAKADLNDVRDVQMKKLARLREFEHVRRNFKNARYDDMRSSIQNSHLLNNALAEFLRGVVSGNDVWRVIQRNQHYARASAQADFGSGSLGNIGDILIGNPMGRRTRRGTTWSLPKARQGGGSMRGGARRNRSSGGFRTGGGF